MVLLHLLHALAAKHSWRLVVAHFNHKLRGRSSDADEKFVRKTAEQLGLPIKTGLADVKRIADELGISIEMAARKLRHDFFASIACEQKIKTVGLAHHADDQVELFFLRLLRGAGSEGLAGMKWKNPSPASPKIELIRPLLDAPKSALREFAKAHGIKFREDASNVSLDFQRNRIRGELLPLLRGKYQSATDKTILRVMEIVGAESEFVFQAAKEWLSKPGETKFDDLPVAVQRRSLQVQLTAHGVAADFELIESLRANPLRAVSVASEVSVLREASGQIKLRRNVAVDFDSNEMVEKLKGRAGEILFSDVRITWKLVAKIAFDAQRHSANTEFFDAAKVSSKIVLRHWRVGDRFQPIGMNSSVKLQDLLTNAKIPREQRHGLIVAATERGEIFWVEGLRIGERFKLERGTLQALKWHWQRH